MSDKSETRLKTASITRMPHRHDADSRRNAGETAHRAPNRSHRPETVARKRLPAYVRHG